jgi:hypothetical protein
VFGIVGVTDGRAFTGNPYLATQYAWASKGTPTATLYMNLNAPVGSTVNGNTATPKTCAHKDKVCEAYNYGYHAASAAFTYASGLGATSNTWWLDVETGNSWSSRTAVNAAVIQGAIDSLTGAGVTAGIYSTPSMWATIVGTAAVSAVPGWIAGYNTGSGLCGSTVFSGGAAILVQQAPSNGVDTDYAC